MTFAMANTTGSRGDCNFQSIEDFFDYTFEHHLNITEAIESCQNLCILLYGHGNPDLSGIGMMYAYSVQVALTILFGPIYKVIHHFLAHLTWEPRHGVRHLVNSCADIQIVFWESNTFIILASAVATLVRIRQKPPIFEISEMRILIFVQLNSLLITFFCLVHPVRRWWQRFFQFILGFALATAALSQARLSSSRETLSLQANQGCQSQSVFREITPIDYHKYVVFLAAGLCGISFIMQTFTILYSRIHRHGRWNQVLQWLKVLWALLTTASFGAMLWGHSQSWRLRSYLITVARGDFEDNQWGFGQVAAMFTWVPIALEAVYKVNGE
ncbi:hypothetical protein GQ53DRAFT_776313 [Thozetella sp. PMI_491]|nr:hypothetical protein GQ53DRAFT_776313 [Thozetella sp. PMI_491]